MTSYTACASALVWGLLSMGCASTDSTMTANRLRFGAAIDHTQNDMTLNGGPAMESDSTLIGINGGYRVTSNLELGGTVTYEDVSVEGFPSTESYQLGPTVRYYFTDEGDVQPWVSGGFGIASFDDVTTLDGSYYQFGVGVSYFASPWAALEVSINYNDMELEGDSVGGLPGAELDFEGLSYNFGISVFF